MPGRDRHPSQRARRPSGRGPHGHVQHEPRIVSAGRGGRDGGRAGRGGGGRGAFRAAASPPRWLTGRGRGAEGRRWNAAAIPGVPRGRPHPGFRALTAGPRRAAGGTALCESRSGPAARQAEVHPSLSCESCVCHMALAKHLEPLWVLQRRGSGMKRSEGPSSARAAAARGARGRHGFSGGRRNSQRVCGPPPSWPPPPAAGSGAEPRAGGCRSLAAVRVVSAPPPPPLGLQAPSVSLYSSFFP